MSMRKTTLAPGQLLRSVHMKKVGSPMMTFHKGKNGVKMGV